MTIGRLLVKHLLFSFVIAIRTLPSLATTAHIPLPALPYTLHDLEPYISAKTLEFHHGKHHQGYVDKVNALIEEKGLKGKSLEELIQMSSKDPQLLTLFNNAAQTWNHTFYWQSMKKGGGGQPTGDLLDRIKKDFSSFESFREKFIEEGSKLFGSGWVWLVLDGDHLKIIATKDADLPLVHGQKALMTCDIWEHAYYLDYQNQRKSYVEVFLDHLVNWDFVSQNLKK